MNIAFMSKRGGYLVHIPKKLADLFDADMLRAFDIEQIRFDQAVPTDPDAREAAG